MPVHPAPFICIRPSSNQYRRAIILASCAIINSSLIVLRPPSFRSVPVFLLFNYYTHCPPRLSVVRVHPLPLDLLRLRVLARALVSPLYFRSASDPFASPLYRPPPRPTPCSPVPPLVLPLCVAILILRGNPSNASGLPYLLTLTPQWRSVDGSSAGPLSSILHLPHPPIPLVFPLQVVGVPVRGSPSIVSSPHTPTLPRGAALLLVAPSLPSLLLLPPSPRDRRIP